MNISKNKKNPVYKCDKCGATIDFKYRRGYQVHKYFKWDKYSYAPKKEFDLCENCERLFRNWLNTKELPTLEEKIRSFPRYYEEK